MDKILEIVKKNLVLMLCLGVFYLLVETIYTAIMSFNASLIGHTSLWMIPVGGLMGWFLGLFNNGNSIMTRLNPFWQCIVGMICIYIIEFGSGYLLNITMGLGIWDYSKLWFNVEGQITFLFIPLWFLICPLAFFVDDRLRNYFSGNPLVFSNNIMDYYTDVFNPFAKVV